MYVYFVCETKPLIMLILVEFIHIRNKNCVSKTVDSRNCERYFYNLVSSVLVFWYSLRTVHLLEKENELNPPPPPPSRYPPPPTTEAVLAGIFEKEAQCPRLHCIAVSPASSVGRA